MQSPFCYSWWFDSWAQYWGRICWRSWSLPQFRCRCSWRNHHCAFLHLFGSSAQSCRCTDRLLWILWSFAKFRARRCGRQNYYDLFFFSYVIAHHVLIFKFTGFIQIIRLLHWRCSVKNFLNLFMFPGDKTSCFHWIHFELCCVSQIISFQQ